MKAVTRQRPKNANYSVSSNPTHTNGAPLKAKPRTRQPEKQPQRPKKQDNQPTIEGDGGKMTKFRCLDDIPDFTDDFGRDKSDIEIVDSPYGKADPVDHYNPPSSHYNSSPTKEQHVTNHPPRNTKNSVNRAPPPALRGPPPPLPAENQYSQNKQKQMEYPSPHRGNNVPAPCFDNNSCDSVDTDFSDDDDDDCNNSYFSSTDDYHVDYTPSNKQGGKKNNGVPQKGRVVRPVKPVQNSYPTKQPAQHGGRHESRNVNGGVTKEPREINYKPYTIQQYRKIKPQEYVEFSKLKPDLNTTELVTKRANAERIKQFSKNLNDFNRVSIRNNVSADEKESKNRVKVLSNREKARQFAQNVPKPKVNESKAVPPHGNKVGRNIGVSSAPTSKIDELTSRHQQSKKQVDAIKKSMGL